MAIKARAQKTLTKIFDGSGVFSIIATNENTSIPISNQGLPLNYSSTPTDVYVYSGTSLLTPVASNPEAGQFTLTASGENISAGLVTINGNHASLANASNMTVGKSSYSITLTASGKDFLGNPFSAQKKQVITPLKRGDDATSYWENVSSSVITKDVKGNMTPDSTTVSAVYQSGMADPDSYSGIFKVYLKSGINFSTTPDYISSTPEQLHKITPKSDTNDIKVELYDVTGTNLLDIQTVPVISQANGVISTKIVYTVTSSQVQPNDSANWSDTVPTVGKGQYLWTKTTFYYTDGSNAVAYSLGSNGKDGASAALLTLVADSQIVTFDSDGATPLPASQTITLTAVLQNLTGTATFVATPYLGTAAGKPVTLGGTGNVRTLTDSQFGSQYDSISVKATLGDLSDTTTIHKLTKGKPGDPGPKGADGSTGAPGPKGADGKTTYVHFAYANSADGKTDFSTTENSGKKYIGTLTDETENDSTDYRKYTWSLIKGEDGADGTPGPKGADGKTTYVHFAYANSSDGKANFSTTDTTGRAYVGVLTNTTIADSNDYTRYTWSLIKGADGANGKNGTNSYSGWLTNESITLQADSNGNVPSFTSATGSLVVYNGLTQVTGLTITQANASGITVSLSGMNYSVTGMSADNGYVDLSVTTGGITIIKRLTVAKSKAGATGANGTSVVNSTTPPRNPTEGQWWNDLSVIPNILKVYQKGSWIPYRIDAINLVAGSVKTSNLAADVLLASNVKYTNSNGTTTNLQTFDFDGIKTLLTDTHGNTYSSMDNAVSSTQSWTSLSKQVNNLGQVNQLINTEFSPDFAGWYDRGLHGNAIKASLGTPRNGSNVISKVDGSPTRLQSEPIAVTPGMKVSYSVNKLSSITLWSYLNCSDKEGNIINVPNTSSNEIVNVGRNNTGFIKIENITIPDGVYYVSLGFLVASTIPNGDLFQQPMLVFSESVGAYVPGQYNNNARVLKIEKSADDFQISIGRSVKDAKSSADSANTKVDNLSVGGRNYVLNTNVSTTSKITEFYSSVPSSYFNNKKLTVSVQLDYDNITVLSGHKRLGVEFVILNKDGSNRCVGSWKYPAVGDSFHGRISTTWDFSNNEFKDIETNRMGQGIYVQGITGTNVSISKPKLEIGTSSTDWTPAPEDIEAGIDTAQSGVNTLSQVNLINNSDFSPDLAGWTSRGAGNFTTGDYDYEGGVYIVESTSTSSIARTSSAPIPLNSLTGQLAYSLSFNSYIFNLPSGGKVTSQLTFLDSNLNEMYSSFPGFTELTSNGIGKWVNTTLNNITFTPPTGAVYVVFSFDSRGIGTKAGFNRPILVKGASVGSYVRGDYGMSTTTVLKLTADNYSMGIDANGNLVSGISGNKQQVTLRGNAINLDGNTNVTGDFYALGGNFTNINIANVSGHNPSLIKSNFESAYGNVSITPTDITLQSYNGTSLMTELAIGSGGITIKMPGITSFLDSTLINANGITFQHGEGSYATVGVMDAGFIPDNNVYGGSPMSIRIGDGVHNMADNMTFAISAAQDKGNSPQLIWAGARVGKITTKYRTWDNPQGFIIADNIKFSTWDNTASRVEFDDTVEFYNYAPIQVYGQRFTDGSTRELRLFGKDTRFRSKWFGFMNGQGTAGFGVDDTEDVMFFMKGKVYSLYEMLGRLHMR